MQSNQTSTWQQYLQFISLLSNWISQAGFSHTAFANESASSSCNSPPVNEEHESRIQLHLILPLTLPMIISRSKKMISNLGASYHYWRGPFLKLAVSDLLLAPFVGGPDPHELANREGGLISCFHGFRGHEPNNFNRDRARHLPSSEAKHSGMNLTLAHLLVRPLERTSFPDSNRPFSDADNSLIQNQVLHFQTAGITSWNSFSYDCMAGQYRSSARVKVVSCYRGTKARRLWPRGLQGNHLVLNLIMLYELIELSGQQELRRHRELIILIMGWNKRSDCAEIRSGMSTTRAILTDWAYWWRRKSIYCQTSLLENR